jgi:hypothetical protein
VAGCHGGGEGGGGGCGGTGQPANATGADTVVVVVDGAGGRAGCPAGGLVGAGRAWGEGIELATRPELFVGAPGGEPDVATRVATDATIPKRTIAAADHQRLSPRDKGTSYSRERWVRAWGTAPATSPLPMVKPAVATTAPFYPR